MTDYYEYYIDEKLNRQRAVARAKRYSAQCYHKRNRRNYRIAIIAGLVLGTLFWAWQLTRPEPSLVESAATDTQYSEVDFPINYEPVVSAMLAPLGEFDLTAYCACETCCGKWALNRPLDENGNEIIYTASGERAEAGVTVAVDTDVIPLGTEICIDTLGVFKAQDTGAFSGNVIDIYFENHADALEFGRQTANVWEVYHE